MSAEHHLTALAFIFLVHDVPVTDKLKIICRSAKAKKRKYLETGGW